MKYILSMAALLFALLSAHAVAAVDEEQMMAFEADCRTYAKEDKISEDEIEAYINQCIDDLVKYQSGEEQSGSGDRD
jgi:hypothetical protein